MGFLIGAVLGGLYGIAVYDWLESQDYSPISIAAALAWLIGVGFAATSLTEFLVAL